MKRAPSWMQATLWSVDVSKLDVDENKNYVITQSLNYGTERVIEWLFDNFEVAEITRVVANPARGLWYAKVLNYWQKRLGLDIPSDKWQKAIKCIYPKNGQNILGNN